MMEKAVENLEKQMANTDETLQDIAGQLGDIGTKFVDETGGEIELMPLFTTISDMKSRYVSLHKEVSEVHFQQKQISTTLQLQIRELQKSFNELKVKMPRREI